MIGSNPALDQFLSEHSWAVVTTLRKDGSASSSVNAYARDGDTLIVSTTRSRLKVKTLERDPRITLCVLTDGVPFNFVSVEGTARIEYFEDGIVEATRKLFANIQGAGYSEPPDLEAWLKREGRVIIRVHAERVSGVIR